MEDFDMLNRKTICDGYANNVSYKIGLRDEHKKGTRN